MLFGAAYYPEHWEEERWEIDAKLMEEAGFNVVRIGEFAWCRLEKEDGVFDFEWLDRVIEILSKHGIKVILGTPSATMPRWLQQKYPEVLASDYEGKRYSYGGRRYYCPNSKVYRYYVERIVTKLAERYGNNPNVIGWQIDNEVNGENSMCYCEICEREFKNWVKQKYQTIENLNKEWGLIFWSHELNSFDEVFIPRKSVSAHNPSLMLDYKRFMSESFIDFVNFQVEILRKYVDKNQIITHNFMGEFDEIDYFKLAKKLDIIGYDCYHTGFWGSPPEWSDISHKLSIMRGLKEKNFWMIEQQSGAGGWQIIGDNPRPGEIRLWAYHSIAEGADGIIFFRWRTVTFGMEEYWHGILDHDGIARRRYEEVKKMGLELKKIGEQIESSIIQTPIAMLRSYDNSWVFKIQPHNKEIIYNSVSRFLFQSIREQNYMVDIISEDCDFKKYRVLIAPLLIMAKQNTIEKLYDFVKEGGILILTFRTGAKDWNNKMLKSTLPGPFKEMVGAEVYEYDALFSRTNKIFSPELGIVSDIKGWADLLKPKSAKVIAEYVEDYMKGWPAIIENQYGKGKVFYIGTWPTKEFIKKLIKKILQEANISPLYNQELKGILMTERKHKGYKLIFILNYESFEKEIDNLFGECYDLITGEKMREKIKLMPYDVKILMINIRR